MNSQRILVVLTSTQMLTSSLISLSGFLNQAENGDQPESVFQEITTIHIHKAIDLLQVIKQFPVWNMQLDF